jgi:hypothetical protein
MFPDMKRVIIEKKEEDLFEQILRNKGKVNYFYYIYIYINFFQ